MFLVCFSCDSVDVFLNLASMDMTATVSSKAALGKKKSVAGVPPGIGTYECQRTSCQAGCSDIGGQGMPGGGIKVRIKMLSIIDGTKTSATWVHTKQPKPFLGLILMSQWWASTLTISQRRKHSKTPRTSMLAGGKPKKAPTDSRNSFF